ncbi:MFS general substrate transporter [Gonapodya prolifera JEL478]|uniref:MFS general substrate transporter n=1 Tax=Gonapodya prolifera (strain JEL478) TaxID=1344416 RepID=A0A139AGI7_GONPJ|nr:MFS general substrate transporter [Gonapodya prolifera JEL478]|eukprot:KXS15942.1 MFS general substrate transporter [Gonapodya prolifera JEL478]
MEKDTEKTENESSPVTWSKDEETAAMRKIDYRIVPWLMLCYTALNIDRGNISNAAIMNAETPTHTLSSQLGLVNNQFNWALSAFFFGYVAFEIPSNLMITRFNPSRWIARIMTTWGICAALMGATTNFAGLVAVRVAIGSMEAGYSPGTAFYLTFWYKKYEVSSRWAYMYGGAGVISSFGGLIAYAVANMDGVGGLAGWRWLFILEGLASALVGVGTWFILPDYPQTAKFLTEREKEIIIGRLPPTGPSMLAKKMEMSEVLDAFRDWRMYAFGIGCTMQFTTAYAIAYFLPTVIKLMGFSSTTAQLLTVAPSLVGSFWIFFINWSSDRFQEKGYHGAACLIPPIIGYFLLANIQTQLSPYQRYGLLFLTSVCNGVVPILIGFSTITTKGASRTALRSAFTIACGNIGGAVGSQVYQPDDAPLYVRGHYINGSLLIAVLVLLLFLKFSIEREGEFVGAKANITVIERGGIVLDNEKLIEADRVIHSSS